jgi:hypothetical protein
LPKQLQQFVEFRDRAREHSQSLHLKKSDSPNLGPAMEAGVSDRVWSIDELIALL